MDFLETIFWELREERLPSTPALKECERVIHDLLEKVKETMGVEMVDKIDGVYGEHEDMACNHFFHCGLRLGLELLRL